VYNELYRNRLNEVLFRNNVYDILKTCLMLLQRTRQLMNRKISSHNTQKVTTAAAPLKHATKANAKCSRWTTATLIHGTHLYNRLSYRKGTAGGL